MDVLSAAPKPKLNALTTLRFVAAAGIVLHHCGGFFGLPADMSFGERAPLGLGVSFFFVLSGFILTYVYPELDSNTARARFLLARFARIWPCHVFALALCCLVHGYNVAYLRQNGLVVPYLANLGLIHSWVPAKRFYMAAIPPSWTISTELAFYLLFPLLIWRLDRTWHVKLVGCLLLSLGLVGVCSSGLVSVEVSDGLLYFGPLGRIFEFSLGMTTALLFRNLGPRFLLGRFRGTLVEVASLSLVVVNGYYCSDMVNWVISRSGTPAYVRVWFFHGISCFGFALLIFVIALGRGWVSRSLACSGFVLLGEISYAVYLLHIPLLGYMSKHSLLFDAYPDWFGFTIYVSLLLVLSHLTWVAIECPMRTLLIGLWPRSTSRSVALGPRDPARGHRRLASPAGFVLAFELVLIASFIHAAERRPYRILPNEKAVDLAKRSRPDARDIRFGDRYLLRGVLLRPIEQGLKLGLMWESRREQALDGYVAVHLFDTEGKVLGDFSYVQDERRRFVKEGMIWLETRVIPHQQISEAAIRGMMSLGVGIGPISGEPTPLYHPDSGPRDDGNWRILLKVSELPKQLL